VTWSTSAEARDIASPSTYPTGFVGEAGARGGFVGEGGVGAGGGGWA
jgi:hypothetical protein